MSERPKCHRCGRTVWGLYSPLPLLCIHCEGARLRACLLVPGDDDHHPTRTDTPLLWPDRTYRKESA